MKIKLAMTLLLVLIVQNNAYSEEVYLKNKDRITGEIIKENSETISLETKTIGIVSIKKDDIERIKRTNKKKEKVVLSQEKEKAPEVIWKKEISAGYNATRGNTEDDQFASSIFINMNRTKKDEITLKGNMFVSTVDDETNAQTWYTMARYAFSFGKSKHWYNFYRTELDHDKFAKIDYRLTPAAGIGYWFFDNPDLKLMAEIGGGVEHTEYNNETENSDEMVLIPRTYYEQDFFGFFTLVNNLYFYPLITDWGEYRLRSESSVIIPGAHGLSVKLSLVNDYNSNPAEGAKKHDKRFISSLVYGF